jgi:hypothetical protein
MPATASPRKPRTVRSVEDVPLDGTPEPKPDGRTRAARQLRRVQAAVADEKTRLPEEVRAQETADGVLAVPIAGRKFRIQESLGLMPLMEWAAVTESVDVDNQGQLASLFYLLKDLVDPEDWDAFRKFTRDEKCTDEDFIDFVNASVEAIAALPTAEPAGS